MLSKLLVACLVAVIMMASVDAQNWVFKIEKVEVNKKKPDGNFWDAAKGAPDLRVVVYSKATTSMYRKEFETKIFKDVYIADKIDNTCVVSLGKELKIEVWDNDIGRHDLVGSTFLTFNATFLVEGSQQLPAFGSVSVFIYSLAKSQEDIVKDIKNEREQLEKEKQQLQKDKEALEEERQQLQMREEVLDTQEQQLQQIQQIEQEKQQWEEQKKQWEAKEQEYQKKIQEMELDYQLQIAKLNQTITELQIAIAQQTPVVTPPTPPTVPDEETPTVPDEETPTVPDEETPTVPTTPDTVPPPDNPAPTFNEEPDEFDLPEDNATLKQPTEEPIVVAPPPIAPPPSTPIVDTPEIIQLRQEIRNELEKEIIQARKECYRELERNPKIRKFLDAYRKFLGE